MKKWSKKYRIDIEMEFGSEYQYDYGYRMLEAMLAAWEYQLRSSHKGNKISIQNVKIA